MAKVGLESLGAVPRGFSSGSELQKAMVASKAVGRVREYQYAQQREIQNLLNEIARLVQEGDPEQTLDNLFCDFRTNYRS